MSSLEELLAKIRHTTKKRATREVRRLTLIEHECRVLLAALEAPPAAVAISADDLEILEDWISENPEAWDAWQRLRASLSPDREAVAKALVLHETVLDECAMPRGTMDYWREMADAAIQAMQGVSK